jgi:ectoine hydroxylase-related dioxygenase (phytanoyl-CoA dioxygenase family)
MNSPFLTDLTDGAGALAGYSREGAHIEPNVFKPGLCDRLIAIASEFPAVKAGDFRTVLQPHRHSQAFLEALRHPRVTGILKQILGAKISGIQTQFFYGKPGTPGFQPHQDSKFVKAPRGRFASVWIALTDVSRENGCLYIYPGSYRERLLDVEEVDAKESMLQDINALRLRCIVPDKYKPVDIAMQKGGAVFFDGYTVHGSHPNASQRHRYALLMTYVARGTAFVAGRYAHREEVFID